MKIRFIVAAIFLAGTAHAAPYQQPDGFYLLSADLSHPVQYSPTSSAANWEITQSGAAASLPAFTKTGDYDWTTSDAQEQVSVTDTGFDWLESIGQFGAACSAGEFDSYIQPGRQAQSGTKPFLNKIAHLKVSGALTVDAEGMASAAPCPGSHADASYGITLSDTAVTPNQRLFYALQLAAVCVGPCRARTGAVWYWTGANHISDLGGAATWNYGVSDVPSSFGASAVKGLMVETDYSIDLLPRIKALIASEGSGIDPKISDWRFAGDTRGQADWGSAELATTWEGWQLHY